jgi:hypothetical protein
MVDLNATLGEELLEVPIGQSVTQVPAHCQQYHLRREPEPGETLTWAAWMGRMRRRWCFTLTASSIGRLGTNLNMS